LRYFTEFGKPVFQHITASIFGGINAQVYCILQCVYDVVVKKVHVRYLISRLLVSFLLFLFKLLPKQSNRQGGARPMDLRARSFDLARPGVAPPL